MKKLSAPFPSAHALVRWAVLLMGWVWLGQQGQRLGWSVASGVLAVALWWAWRALFAQSGFIHRLPRQASVWLGVSTVGGALGVASLAAGPMAHALLLVLAGVWALWSAFLEAGSHGPIANPCGAEASLPQTAMGLMMGSLWLTSSWCTTAGLPPATVVGFHVLLMAVLPALTSRWHLPPWAAQAGPLALVLAGSLVLQLGNGVAHGATGMALLALAWALQGPQGHALRTARRWSALAGPALLLAVGWYSPTLGPQVLQAAYGLLGAGAFLALLGLGLQATTRFVHHRTPGETFHEQH
ncbi:MAG: hypothetical protein Q8S96_07165 [Hydrogenophaga sp.]|uniref:hypothetical protein n=1 Tax=Hydrogenophaga sp. TaxID=1904254 RepID=UPI0027365C66|nr:hypothetical protein [Hydrogenophaga sp.]MDP3344221.1 hypothetical protein [Hydrogenophaga sp.]MDP3807413.1 hypothetical protein [Hydrogenophaga sp.]